MNNKYAMPLVILAVGAFLFVAFFTFEPVSVNNDHAETVTGADITVEQQPTYLFTQTAGAGTFENTSDDEYILTLTNVDPNVVYFSDRPVRDAGEIGIVQFLNGLGFEIGDPPNAAIITETENGEEVTVVAELTQPIYDRDTRELIYKAIILHDASGQLAEYGSSDVVPESFTKATLLIDGCAKKGDVFCGSAGKCMDPDKEKCGGTSKDSWKKHKDKECHKMKLKDAYDIAAGSESECLLYDDARLSDSEYECKGEGTKEAWRIKMNTNTKGEASKCHAYCLIYPSEEHSRGVARIEYYCHDDENEKGDKNKYCPTPEIKNDHHYKDTQEKLIGEYHHILSKASDHKTSYEHHYCVTTGMPYATNKHWATDCSGLGGYALFHTLPYHYHLVDKDRDAHAKADRPLAADFYNFIHKQSTENKGGDSQCWQKIENIEDAQQGDFLIVKYGSKNKESDNSTGHVMWIDEVHNGTGGHRKITVIDSAKNGHGSDTRKDDNTYNCKKDHDCGIGKGNMWFYPDKGKPESYKWDAHPDGDKRTGNHIVIGRVLDCKAKK